jgi:outer membrane protein TolC
LVAEVKDGRDGRTNDSVQLDHLRATHIEAERLLEVAETRLRQRMRTLPEWEIAELIRQARAELVHGKRYICALHIDSTEQNDIAIE